ncbi:exonuclease SbcCD subunit D C-terminal domain-containing protein [Pseudoalteromonas 'SMAR']|uniref:exonuclease SbcCD subunit D C-terminal domain-containing protein n=1 Tax=Pseudoalteromonas 'SMAR' TaxID=3416908 RepID=UPI003AF25912
MKVLHTSDWHLGQSFYEHERAAEHQQFLDWLSETLQQHQVDILLISGDIFHTATPPASAEKQLYTFIQHISKHLPQLHIVLIAGNHDSASGIETAKPLLQSFNTHVVGHFDKNAPEQVVLTLATATTTAHVVAMPFLRGGDLPRQSGDNSYQQGVAQAYQQAIDTIAKPSGPIILMGHLHAKGGSISEDSERNINIGGFDAVSANVFGEQFDYVALGHLHKAQTVAKQNAIRYSGTPLPMSFSERNYQHQVLLLEFSDSDLLDVKPLYIPRFQHLLYIPEQGAATLDELCEQINNTDFGQYEEKPYVRLRLSATESSSRFRAEIDAALKDKPVLFCGIERVSKADEDKESQFEDLGKVESLSVNTLLDIAYREIDPEQQAAPKALHDKLAAVITAMED